ncbi:MAG: S-layer homology domain-containing protein [Syntrophomonadaceae bacterium]|nr:S-layer homology domain-containing protein [Syntrophomonadaceae bacterium]
MKYAIKIFLSTLLTLILALSFRPPAAFAANSVKVYMDFEGYNLGQGYYIEPTALELAYGATAAEATIDLLERLGYEYDDGGNPETFFLSAVRGFDKGTVIIPNYIPAEEGAPTTENNTGNSDDWLGGGDYSTMSAWFITVNHEILGTGAAEYVLKDGDVLRWQFTVWGFGADFGLAQIWGGDPYYTHADKTALIRALFAPEADENAKNTALQLIINPLATQEQVETALAALLPSGPKTDKSQLEEAIKNANSLIEESYTSDSWEALQTALTFSQTVYNDENAAQSEINSAISQLSGAIDSLISVIPPGDLNIDQIRHQALTWLKSNKESPDFGSEWHVLALARSDELDENWAQIYLNNLETDAQFSGKTGPLSIHDTKVTENERLVLALTALGIDAENWNERDLISPLFDTDYIEKQGINGSIFGIIAFNSADYEVPPAVKAFCLNSILENQLADKGWTLYGDTADPDTTGMALQALAPYYAMGETAYNALGIEGAPVWNQIQTSVNGAIQTLSNIQENDGAYISWGAANAENCAQVLTTLCLLGIDPETDMRFIKNGKSVLDALISFRDDDTGGFKHITTGPVNSAATEHAAYALVAHWRMKNHMNPLYDMTDAAPRLPSQTVNKTALNSEISKAEKLNQDSYTSSTWNNLQTVLLEAKAAAADSNATQNVVNTAKSVLTEAINALQTVGADPSNPSDSIRVTFRLIGSTLANDDIDLGDNDYKGAHYVTWIPTSTYTINKNATVYDLFVTALANAELNAVGAEKNYIESIYAPSILGSYRLSELANGKYSGWLYTINGKHIGYGLKEHILPDNAEIVWHYVNDYRYEVEDWFEGMNYPGMGNYSTWNKWLEAPDRAPKEDDNPSSGSDNDLTKTNNASNGIIAEKSPLTSVAMPHLVTEIEIKSAVIDNVAKAETTAEEIEKAIAEATSAGNTAIAVTVTGAEDAKSTELIMAKDLLTKLKEANMELVVNAPFARIAFSKASLESVITTDGEIFKIAFAPINKTVDLNAKQQDAVKDNPAIELTIWSGDNIIRYFEGKITVSIPYQPKEHEDPDLITAYYLDDEGNFQEMKNARYDPETSAVLFETVHFSKFFVSEWLSPFDDIAKEDWFYKAVRFNYANDLIKGMEAANFAPNDNITRTQFVTILYRLEGEPPVTDRSAFSDVTSEQWYSAAVTWAANIGVISGYGGGIFGADDPVTREQIAAIIYRYAQWKKIDVSQTTDLSGYSDADSISDWAQAAMNWVSATGLIQTNTAENLAPVKTATRAEAAALFQHYIETVAKV